MIRLLDMMIILVLHILGILGRYRVAENHIYLCSNDINLRNKAIASGLRSYCSQVRDLFSIGRGV